MISWLRRGLIALVTVAVLYVVGGGVATTLLVTHLLTPGSVDWAGYGNPNPPADPFELGYRGDPKAAFGLYFETVTYDTELGPAEAWLVPAAKPEGPWAVYVHGIGGIRENGYRQLSILHEAGIPTLMITYRNDRGAPAGDPVYSFGVTEWRDLDAAMAWLLHRGAPSVIIAAESMGGGITGQFLMHSQQVNSVAALALDAPALDFPAVVADKLGARHLPFANSVAAVAVGMFDLYRNADLAAAVSLDAVAQFPRPLFLAHGAADSLVPITIADRLVEQRTASTVFLRTGADHLRSYKEEPARYRAEMLGWLATLFDAASKN